MYRTYPDTLITYLDRVSTDPAGFKVFVGSINLDNANLNFLPFSGIHITGNFSCKSNVLTSLEGAPAYVGESFDCSDNLLQNLYFSPTAVGGDFACQDMPTLTSIEGICSTINRNLVIIETAITSLYKGPTAVSGNFICLLNPKLSSLEFGPILVGGKYDCKYNSLTSLHFSYCN